MNQSTQVNTAKSHQWVAQHWFTLIVIMAAILIGLSVANFLHTHKKIAAPARYQLTQNALKNQFFVSQLLLEQQHKLVKIDHGELAHQALKQVWQQPAETAKHTTVILLTVSQNQSNDIPAILNWMQRGGHLVTFSQDVLPFDPKNTDQSTNDSQLASYSVNENALLTHLGIKNVQTDNPHRRLMAQLNNQAAATPLPTSPIADDSLTLASKVLLKLPSVLTTPSTNSSQTNNVGGVGIVMSSSNPGRLDTQAFFQKYPKATPIADYNWFEGLGNTKNVKTLTQNQLILKNANQWQVLPLNKPQLAAVTQKIIAEPYNFVPANQALMDVRFGQGRLTIANDNEIFSNPAARFLADKQALRQNQNYAKNSVWASLLQPPDSPNIAQFDNAYLLNYLTADRNTVWLVPNVSVPSLPTLLWRNLTWACVAFILCVLAGLLALPKRFGRAKVYQDDSQTNIFGYFDQVGEYVWQDDQANALVSQNRERLLEKIVATYPQLQQLQQLQPINSQAPQNRQIDPQKVCQLLADNLGISYQMVALALFEPWQSEQQFISISRAFALLAKRLKQKL